MKLLKTLFAALAVLLAAPSIGSEAGSHCPEELDYYESPYDYNGKEAYQFGLLIQKRIEERDLAGLFDLVDGELVYGPRQRFVAGRKFEDIFTEEWRSNMLSDEPPCDPTGWRGFLVGKRGSIRFKQSGPDTYTITHIFGAAREEPYPPAGTDRAWRIEGQLIEPTCFIRQWISWDNYKAAFRNTSTTTVFDDYRSAFDDFLDNPGRHFGPDYFKEKSPLVTFPPACGHLGADAKNSEKRVVAPLILNEGYLSRKSCSWRKPDKEWQCSEDWYKPLAPISVAACASLAPHLAGHCEGAYLVDSGDSMLPSDYYSGSMTASFARRVSHSIFGLFMLEDGRRVMVPLVNFDSRNEAMNFVDDLNAGS